MTRDEAEQALDIARAALREVGEDPEALTIDDWNSPDHGLSGAMAELTFDVWRAAAIGVSAVDPTARGICWTHAIDASRRRDCQEIPVARVLRGVTSCEAVTA